MPRHILFSSEDKIGSKTYTQITQCLADLEESSRKDCIRICKQNFEVVGGGKSYLNIEDFFQVDKHSRGPDREYFFRTVMENNTVVGFALFSFILSQVLGKFRLEVDMQLVAFDKAYQKKGLVWLYALATLFNLQKAVPFSVDIFCIVNDRSYRLFRGWSHTTGAETHPLQNFLQYLFEQVFIAHKRRLRIEDNGAIRLAEPVLKLPNLDVNAACDLVLVADGSNVLNETLFTQKLREHGLLDAYVASSPAAIAAWRVIYTRLALRSLPEVYVETILQAWLSGEQIPYNIEPPIRVYFPHLTIRQLLALEATEDLRVMPRTEAWQGRLPNMEHYGDDYPYREAVLDALHSINLSTLSVKDTKLALDGYISLDESAILKAWKNVSSISTWEDLFSSILLNKYKIPINIIIAVHATLSLYPTMLSEERRMLFILHLAQQGVHFPENNLRNCELRYMTLWCILFRGNLSKIFLHTHATPGFARYLICRLANTHPEQFIPTLSEALAVLDSLAEFATPTEAYFTFGYDTFFNRTHRQIHRTSTVTRAIDKFHLALFAATLNTKPEQLPLVHGKSWLQDLVEESRLRLYALGADPICYINERGSTPRPGSVHLKKPRIRYINETWVFVGINAFTGKSVKLLGSYWDISTKLMTKPSFLPDTTSSMKVDQQKYRAFLAEEYRMWRQTLSAYGTCKLPEDPSELDPECEIMSLSEVISNQPTRIKLATRAPSSRFYKEQKHVVDDSIIRHMAKCYTSAATHSLGSHD